MDNRGGWWALPTTDAFGSRGRSEFFAAGGDRHRGAQAHVDVWMSAQIKESKEVARVQSLPGEPCGFLAEDEMTRWAGSKRQVFPSFLPPLGKRSAFQRRPSTPLKSAVLAGEEDREIVAVRQR